ncbi:ATP-grasp domain-containing protein [Ferruginivarius sediminum]|uniref:ATP-grasp domain-containing protein n=1 Tax=Ferruginivarius sediminum TaxID=2661937 RepID=A0A369T9F9_9PROT|nr:ATP-grasp domain-containing protein [Ferruginivarius sediminum]RDD61930.1 ATP-grasp domain-containing protein [Ferruginivarius sediminum]
MGSVIVIEPSPGGLALVEAGKAHGKHVVLLASAQAGEKVRAAAKAQGAEIVDVDTNDVDAVLEACRSLAGTHEVEAVVPGMDYYVQAAAKSAQALGLPGLSPDLARRLRNKYEVRRMVAEAGVATPSFALVGDDESDVENAAAITGFPAVLKPVDASGSLGVQRVDDLEELQKIVAKRREKALVDVGRRVGEAWMLESYLDGPEYSVEGVIADNGPLVLTVTKKRLGPEPYFIEVGHVVGDALPAELQRALSDYTRQVMVALGLPLGVFHAEVRHTSQGPMLIEVNVRLPGDRITRLVELACGFSLPSALLRSHLHGPLPAAECGTSANGLAGVSFVTAADVKQAPNDVELEALRDQPWVDELEFAGMPENPCCAAFRERLGHVVCTAESAAELDERLNRVSAVLTGTAHAGIAAMAAQAPRAAEAACCPGG